MPRGNGAGGAGFVGVTKGFADRLDAATKRKMVSSLVKSNGGKKLKAGQASSGGGGANKKFTASKSAKGKKGKDENSSDSSSSGDEDDDDDDNAPADRIKTVDIDWPATVVMVAKKFSGKTNAILNIVDPADFDNIFIITVTKHKNNLTELVPKDEVDDRILTSISEQFIAELLEHQIETDARTLLVFDDFIGMKGINLKHSSQMKILASAGRNFNVSILFSSQDLVEISTLFRRNPEYLLVGNNLQSTRETIAKTMGAARLDRKSFQELLNTISKRKQFEFLFIDDRENDHNIVKFPLVLDAS